MRSSGPVALCFARCIVVPVARAGQTTPPVVPEESYAGPDRPGPAHPLAALSFKGSATGAAEIFSRESQRWK